MTHRLPCTQEVGGRKSNRPGGRLPMAPGANLPGWNPMTEQWRLPLSDRMKAVLQARYDGYGWVQATHQEVGAKLGISAGVSVKFHQQAIARLLRTYLDLTEGAETRAGTRNLKAMTQERLEDFAEFCYVFQRSLGPTVITEALNKANEVMPHARANDPNAEAGTERQPVTP